MTAPDRLTALLERLARLHPKLIDLSLDRVYRLLADLGNPQDRLPPIVHIAGTNGKGSTLAYLRAIAEAAGLSVHVYTSPHLVRFAERIRLAGRLPEDAVLADLLEEVEAVNAGRPLTFFEITTCAAFQAFSRYRADLLLLETGLGGRLDATNVVARPAATLFSPIHKDHEQFLGKTIARIAWEKAHIMKPGAPALSARQPPAAMRVLSERARAVGVPLLRAGADWRAIRRGDAARYRGFGSALTFAADGLPGPHQAANQALAVSAWLTLAGNGIVPTLAPGEVEKALAAVRWPARLQRLDWPGLSSAASGDPEVWLDGGHNPSAGRMLARHAAAHWADRPLGLAVGMMAGKDTVGFLRPLLPLMCAIACVPIPDQPGGLSAAALAASVRESTSRPVTESDSAAEAVTALAGQGCGRILIAGSLYLAGSVLRDLGIRPD